MSLNFSLRRVLNNQFVAHVVSREPQLSIILYESSSGRELNINEWILDQVAEKASPIPLKVHSFYLDILQVDRKSMLFNHLGGTSCPKLGHLLRVFRLRRLHAA